MTDRPDTALAAKYVAAEEALMLSTTLATLATVRGHMTTRARILHRIGPLEPSASPVNPLGPDLLLAPVHPDHRQVRELAGSRTLRTIAAVRQRSLADFLG